MTHYSFKCERNLSWFDPLLPTVVPKDVVTVYMEIKLQCIYGWRILEPVPTDNRMDAGCRTETQKDKHTYS